MANFDLAYKKTSINEGGYANVAGDNGGETYAGITRKNFPSWPGWKIVDAFKKKYGLKPGQKINDPELEALKKEFYKKYFWDAVGGDQIEEQYTADTLFDFGVSSGQSRSLKNIQLALGINADGKITKQLVEAINNPINYLV